MSSSEKQPPLDQLVFLQVQHRKFRSRSLACVVYLTMSSALCWELYLQILSSHFPQSYERIAEKFIQGLALVLFLSGIANGIGAMCTSGQLFQSNLPSNVMRLLHVSPKRTGDVMDYNNSPLHSEQSLVDSFQYVSAGNMLNSSTRSSSFGNSPLLRQHSSSPSFASQNVTNASLDESMSKLSGLLIGNRSSENSLNWSIQTQDTSNRQSLSSSRASGDLSRASFNTSSRSPGGIHNEDDVLEYLRSCEEANRVHQRSPVNSPSLENFQLACSTPLSSKDSAQASVQSWKELGIPLHRVDYWIEFLRGWLSLTILRPLLDAVEKVRPDLLDSRTPTSGMSDLMCKVAPYFEGSFPKSYAVKRLGVLANDRCLGNFEWNGGGPQWTETLPTDCALVFHWLCAYLDSRMIDDPRFPQNKVFTEKFTSQSDSGQICLHRVALNPPLFRVLFQKTVYEVPPGRKNFFSALLLFFFLIRKDLDGKLEKISLGTSGINVLWIFDE